MCALVPSVFRLFALPASLRPIILSAFARPKLSSQVVFNCTTCMSHLSRRGHDMAYVVAPNFIRAPYYARVH